MLKKEVLRGQKAFSRVYKKGKSIGGYYTVLFAYPNDMDYNRIAFLASKKVGNSVQRNRARRLMKESFSKASSKTSLKVGYDLIFIARKSINGKKCTDVAGSVEFNIRKLGLIEKSKKGNIKK